MIVENWENLNRGICAFRCATVFSERLEHSPAPISVFRVFGGPPEIEEALHSLRPEHIDRLVGCQWQGAILEVSHIYS